MKESIRMMMKIGRKPLVRLVRTAWQTVAGWLICLPLWADTGDNPIPVSPDDVPTDGSDLITKFIYIIKEFGGLLGIVGALWLLWAGLSGIWGGYKEFRRTSDFTPLKESIAGSALMIVAGAVILALLVVIVKKT